MTLTLVLQARSVILPKSNFLARESGYKRTLIDTDNQEYTGEVSYSIIGTPAIRGAYVRPRFKWEINSLISEKVYDRLWGIFHLQNQLERDKNPNSAITLGDEYEYIIDTPPRKRQAVSGTEIKTTEAGDIKYYGVFKVRIGEPSCVKSGNINYPYMLKLNLTEMDFTAP